MKTGRPRKKIELMSRAEMIEEREKLRKLYEETKSVVESVIKSNPFWYYQPITGEIDISRREFLHRWLKPDDIPQKLDGSLNFHLSSKKIRLASGGNQSSKSYSAVIEAIIKATGKLPYCFDETKPSYYKYKLPERRWKRTRPQHVRVVGFDWENDVVKNLLPKFRELAPKEYLLDGDWSKSWVAGESTLYFKERGQLLGTIEFMSNKQDLASFGGPARDLVVFDEEPFHEVYKENLMRMVTAEDFDVILSMTPVNGISWVYEEIYSKFLAGDDTIDYFQFVSVANPYSSVASLNEIMKGIGSYEEKKMRLLGEFISLSGLVYSGLFKRDLHVIAPFETGCNCGGSSSHKDGCPNLEYLGFLGVDPHMVKDSCMALCFMDREGNFYVDTCYKKDSDIKQMRDDVKELLKGKRMSFSVFDPSSDSSITAFSGLNIFKLCTQNPNPFFRARKGDKYQGSIAAGVQVIKDLLKVTGSLNKPRFFIMDRPENQLLIKSMKTMQRDTYVNEDIRGQKDKIQEGMHDHHACVRYILQNKIRWYPLVENNPQPQIPDWEAMCV
jgi:phage terminase large subunit-like protein